MKTKLEMAHEWAMKHGDAETAGSRQNMIKYAWQYADAMQAEADKRENKTRPEVLMAVQQTFINGIEQPRYATSMGDQKRTPKVSRFERSDAVKEVLNRAENMGLIKPKEPRETHKNLAEFKMHPEYDASINYPPDAWVMYKGEKKLAVSIDIKKEWQPDWSQAPEWAVAWTYDKNAALWWGEVPEIHRNIWFIDGGVWQCADAPLFGYTGDWRESLRKRPQ